ncbi:MAG: hypothetical protein ACRDQX_01485 [Pseudonocardiaceae bacterium]
MDTNLADDDDPTKPELDKGEHLGDEPAKRYDLLVAAGRHEADLGATIQWLSRLREMLVRENHRLLRQPGRTLGVRLD